MMWMTYGRAVRWIAVALGVTAVAALLLSRLLGMVPDQYLNAIVLCALLPAAAVLALAFLRAPGWTAVARMVDVRSGSKDLFLTTVLAGEVAGEYKAVVQEQADEKAGHLAASHLLPWSPWRGLRDVAVAATVVAAIWLWLPRLDPFRMSEKRAELAAKEEQLIESRKITAARKTELHEKSGALTEQVELALEKLDRSLKEVRPEQKEVNARKLNEQAQDFSEFWKRISEQLPKQAQEQFEKAAQAFGNAPERQAVKEAIEQLKKGNPEALQQALQRLQQELKDAAAAENEGERQKKMEAVGREIAKLAEQLKQELGEKNIGDALTRAAEQLDAARNPDLAKAAAEAAGESLELTEDELKRAAELFKDLQKAEDALKNLQMAKELNEKGGLDGKDAAGAGAKTLEDYKALYEKLLAQQGNGGGQGGGNQPGQGAGDNPGQGQGGTRGEAPDTKTALKDEKSKSQVGAGKLLMQWKDEGLGEVGQRPDYQAAVRAVKEGVAEAIRNEQVPSGYHSAIQKYFDRLPATPPKNDVPRPSAPN